MKISPQTQKTVVTVFIIGMLVFTILTLLGQVFLTKLAFKKHNEPDNITPAELSLAKLAAVMIWVQTIWIIAGVLFGAVGYILKSCNLSVTCDKISSRKLKINSAPLR